LDGMCRIASLFAVLGVVGCAAGHGPATPVQSKPGPPPAMTSQTPTPLTPEQQAALLTPYRVRINALDTEIVGLIGKRFDVVREVAALKAEHGIAPILPDRIEEVVARARAKAEEEGVDPKLVEQIYRIMIDEACKLEADYAKAQAAQAAAATQK